MLTGEVKAGVSQIGKGVMNNAVGRFITNKNDPNTIIRSIFAKDVPTAKNALLPKIPLKPSNNSQPLAPSKKLLPSKNGEKLLKN